MSPYLYSNKETGYKDITKFIFYTDMVGEKIIDFGDGVVEVFEEMSIEHTFVNNGEFTVTVVESCSQYPIRKYSTIVKVDQFVQNEIKFISYPDSGYTSEEEPKKFFVEFSTNCPLPVKIDLLVKNAETKHVYQDDLKDICDPVNYFYSDEVMDKDTIILTEDRVNKIIINGKEMGHTGSFCFGYYDDFVGDVDISAKLDVSCAYTNIRNKPQFWNCIGLDLNSFDIKTDFSGIKLVREREKLDADLTHIELANRECIPIKDGEDVEGWDLVNGILKGRIYWIDLAEEPPNGHGGITGQSEGELKYISDITLPDKIELTDDSDPNIYKKVYLGYSMTTNPDVNNPTYEVEITFNMNYCTDCCNIKPPEPSPKYQNRWVLVWDGRLPRKAPLDDLFMTVDPKTGMQYFANAGSRFGTCPMKSPTRWHDQMFHPDELLYPDPYTAGGDTNNPDSEGRIRLIDMYGRNMGFKGKALFQQRGEEDEHYVYYNGGYYELILGDNPDGSGAIDPNNVEYYKKIIDDMFIYNVSGGTSGDRDTCYWLNTGKVQVN